MGRGRGAARTEGGCPQLASGVRSLHCGLWDAWGERGKVPAQVLGHLSLGSRWRWKGCRGEQRGGKTGSRAGRGLAQVLFVTLDGLLDAQQHGGEPLVQPGDGVVLLHLRHTPHWPLCSRAASPTPSPAHSLSQPWGPRSLVTGSSRCVLPASQPASQPAGSEEERGRQ